MKKLKNYLLIHKIFEGELLEGYIDQHFSFKSFLNDAMVTKS